MAKLRKDVEDGKDYLKEQLTNNKYSKNMRSQNKLLKEQNAALYGQIVNRLRSK